ncbi:nitrate- and nitrite sensing domain-containing protein [Streptomyces sp. H27-C3]|uniref:sensor histidine kinase n=1 Tax=Streptomyces sp. H27-C3 TaxID=3046305 RepID=UPI0024B994E9|nr:nitrate- and nitrite sensing domain-containing protein [Streptomyces sp. H27-C3]MDJ0466210.1 nitrate- and nitrite sensing domain-containing protein [Streptomyces sp. H27-C3]
MLSPQHWKISTRMAVALLSPTLLALGLAVSEIRGSLARAERMKVTEESAALVLSATQLAHALANERDFAALQKSAKVAIAPFRTETDERLADYVDRASANLGRPGITERVADTEAALQGLAELRSKAYSKGFDSVATDLAYADMITPLLGLAIKAGRGEGSTASDTWALSSLSIGKASLSSQRALLNAGFSRGKVEKDEWAEAASHGGLQKVVFRQFLVAADEKDAEQFRKAFDSAYIAAMVSKAANAEPSELDAALVKEWNTSATRVIEDLNRIETRIAQRITDDVAHERYEAQKEAWWSGGVVGFALLLALLLATWIVQATVRQLSRLRRTALRAARQELPALAASIAEGGPDVASYRSAAQAPSSAPSPSAAPEQSKDADQSVAPDRSVALDLGTRDEIGDVSRAFEQVFAEALKQTAEQAKLRSSVNDVLASMARRGQVLIHRQLAVISALERTEADPDKLGELFRIDHLATRMRRHGENLLVLAGQNPGRVYGAPAPLVDVLRAAAAEVEQFARIQVVGGAEAWVAAPVVHDLTHLLAELMENATQYSSPATRVMAVSRVTVTGDVLIAIEDSGVGIGPAQLVRLNAALRETPGVAPSTTHRMGLYVVSRLASAHGIRVRIGSTGKGATASVVVPDTVLSVAPPPPPMSGPLPQESPPQHPLAQDPPPQAPAQDPAGETRTMPAAQRPGPGGLPRRDPRATLRGHLPPPAHDSMARRTDPAETRRRVSGFCTGTSRARQDNDSDKEGRPDD